MKSWKDCLRIQIIGSVALLNFVALPSPVNAFNDSQVRQLLQTKECSKCDLSGANLSGADLSFAILTDANLTGANLQNANLSQADLSRANLSQANFRQANLNGAYLTNANLDGTNFSAASIQGTRGLPILPILNVPALNLPPIPSSARLPTVPPLPPPPPLPLPPPLPPPPPITAIPPSLTPPPALPLPQTTTSQIPTIARHPAQNVSPLFSTLPQLAEVRNYFVNRWKPPANLTTSLTYILVMNNDGSLKQIIPHGAVEQTYLDSTEMPLPGERIVSPFPEGQTNKIRVILMPDGRVTTFLEP